MDEKDGLIKELKEMRDKYLRMYQIEEQKKIIAMRTQSRIRGEYRRLQRAHARLKNAGKEFPC